MKSTKILIAGAGPVGLSAAMFLSKIPNVKIDIIEKKASHNSFR